METNRQVRGQRKDTGGGKGYMAEEDELERRGA